MTDIARQVNKNCSKAKFDRYYGLKISTYSAHSLNFPEFWLSTIFKINNLFSSRYCMHQNEVIEQSNKDVTINWKDDEVNTFF